MLMVVIPTPSSSSAALLTFSSYHLKPINLYAFFPTAATTLVKINSTERAKIRRWAVSPSSSDNQTLVTAPSTTDEDDDDAVPPLVSNYTAASASEVVRNFYGGINRRDLASVEEHIADNCVYEDLIFPRPFVGRKEILEFFQKFIDSISTDLQFVIDDISGEDTSAIGVTWHLEWKGKPFPFSKGCSFYRLDVVNGRRKIMESAMRRKTRIWPRIRDVSNLQVIKLMQSFKSEEYVRETFAWMHYYCYGRDSVEPAIKPGEMALVAIRGVTWLLQKLPQLADEL